MAFLETGCFAIILVSQLRKHRGHVTLLSDPYFLFCAIIYFSSVLEKRSIQKSCAMRIIYSVNLIFIYNCFEHIVLCLRNVFKFFGYSQFLEIRATSKGVVLFYDNGLSCCDLLVVLTNYP